MHLLPFGKKPKPEPEQPARVQAPLHPLMQADMNMLLPYWVVTDMAVWGTFSDVKPAIALADRVAQIEPIYSRVFVSHVDAMATVYRTTGQSKSAKQSVRRA